MATRWAICGTGKIANDFCLCLNSLPSSEHQIVAVGASSKQRAEDFAGRFNIPHNLGSYKELSELKDVDVVYVATIHTLHVELCLMFLNAGKPVLCEKPMAMSIEGCQKVLDASKKNNVFFQEATWSRFFPAYRVLRDQMAAGSIGEVKVVQATFTAPISEVPRVKQMSLGGGSIMDIGLYTVQAANMVFKGKPLKVTSDLSLDQDTGVDKTGVVSLNYGQGRFATLLFSSETQMGNNSLIIRGTKGTLQVNDTFWCPDHVILPNGERLECPFPNVKMKESDKFNYGNGQGLTYEAQEVRRCLLEGLKVSPLMSHEDSETIMHVCQTVLQQHGITHNLL